MISLGSSRKWNIHGRSHTPHSSDSRSQGNFFPLLRQSTISAASGDSLRSVKSPLPPPALSHPLRRRDESDGAREGSFVARYNMVWAAALGFAAA